MPLTPTPRRLVLAGTLVLLLSIALRLLLWWGLGSAPQWLPDSSTYVAPAQSLLESSAFLDGTGVPDTVRTPGYPLFIALPLALGWGLSGVVLLQHLLALGMALLLAAWTMPRFGAWAAGAAGALASLNFLLCLYPGFLLSETLFAFLTTGSVLALGSALLSRKGILRRIALAAALAGCAALVRPIGLYFLVPACLTLLLCLPARRLAAALVFLAVFALAPGAWMVRNHALTGQFSLSGIASLNLLGYQAAGTLAVKEGGDYAAAHRRINAQLLAQARERFDAQAGDGPARSLGDIQREMALGIIKDNHGPFVRHLLRNMAATLLGNATTHLERLTGLSPGTARTAALCSTLPALLLALYGLAGLLFRSPRIALLILLTVGYFVSVAALGGVGGSRFRIPVQPLLCLLQGVALADLARRFTGRNSLR